MKANKCCVTCESYMPVEKGMGCAGNKEYYGKNVEKDFVCDEWNYSLNYFIELIDALPADVKAYALDDPRSDAHKVLKKYYDNL